MRMLKWERKFRWLDGGGTTDTDEDDPYAGWQESPEDVDPQGFAGPGPFGANPYGPSGFPSDSPESDVDGVTPGGKDGEGGNGGGGKFKTQEEETEVPKTEKTTKKTQERRKRRPTLLTQDEGLLTQSGKRKSLIGVR